MNWRLRDRRKAVYLLPNLFTAGSLFCALASVVSSSEENFERACYLILASAVLDALDGPVARLTRSASSFGLEFDSLADVVAFGVAPAFLMWKKLHLIGDNLELSKWAPNLALGACSIFVITGAIRLARFNVQARAEERRNFTGLPIPGAAGVVVSAFLFVETYLTTDTKNLHRAILLLMMLLSGFMVSTIPFPKPAALLRNAHNNPNTLIAIVFLACIVFIFWSHLPIVLLSGFTVYIGWSLLGYARAKSSAPKTDPSSLETVVPPLKSRHG